MSYSLQEYLTPPQLAKHFEVLQYLRRHPNESFSLSELDERLPYGASVLRFPSEWVQFMEAGECGNKNIELFYRPCPREGQEEINSSRKRGRHDPNSMNESPPPHHHKSEEEEEEIALICRRPLIRHINELAALLDPPSSQPDRLACIGVHTDQILLAPGVLEEAQRRGVAYYFPTKGTAGGTVDGLYGGYVRRSTNNGNPNPYRGGGGGGSSSTRVTISGSSSSNTAGGGGAGGGGQVAPPTTLEEELQASMHGSNPVPVADTGSGGIPMAFLSLPPGVFLRCRVYTVRGVVVEDKYGLPTRWQVGERVVLLFDNQFAAADEIAKRNKVKEKRINQDEKEWKERGAGMQEEEGGGLGGDDAHRVTSSSSPLPPPPLRVHFYWGGGVDENDGLGGGGGLLSGSSSSVAFRVRQGRQDSRRMNSSLHQPFPGELPHSPTSTTGSGSADPSFVGQTPSPLPPARIRQRTMVVPFTSALSSPSSLFPPGLGRLHKGNPSSPFTAHPATNTATAGSGSSSTPSLSSPTRCATFPQAWGFRRVQVDIDPLQEGDFKLIFSVDTQPPPPPPLKDGRGVTTMPSHREVEERVLDIHIDGPHTSLPGVLIGRERQPSGIELYHPSSPFFSKLLKDSFLLSGRASHPSGTCPVPSAAGGLPSTSTKVKEEEKEQKGGQKNNQGDEEKSQRTEGKPTTVLPSMSDPADTGGAAEEKGPPPPPPIPTPTPSLPLSSSLLHHLFSANWSDVQVLPWWQSPSPLVSVVREYAFPPTRHALNVAAEVVFCSFSRELASSLRKARQAVQRKRAESLAASEFGRSSARRRRRHLVLRGGEGPLDQPYGSAKSTIGSSISVKYAPELCNTHMLFFGVDLSLPFPSSSRQN